MILSYYLQIKIYLIDNDSRLQNKYEMLKTKLNDTNKVVYFIIRIMIKYLTLI